MVTQGKGFTKEKNKKKRGSYRGGLIDQGSQYVLSLMQLDQVHLR